MTKSKKSKPRPSTADIPVQYRPGALLADLIDAKAAEWGVSRNDAARRLAALAACGLDVRDHSLVTDMANAMFGRADFVEGCQRIHVELQAVESTRQALAQAAMTEDQRREAIKGIVQRCVLLAVRFEETEDEQRIRVKQSHRDFD